MLDALSFGLFGKAHRNIKKDQLVNSINEKAMEIEVEFRVSAHSFKVVRGIRPNKFEIWQNGKMINQSSNARDYQKYLEQSILKLNHRSFHQIVVLGSSSFIPFMQLPAGQRREVIEDLLDIQIFSKMNAILKEHLSKIKDELKDLDYQINLTKEKITLQRKYIRDITEMNDEQIRQKRDAVSEYTSEISVLQTRNTTLSEDIAQKNDGLDERIAELSSRREKVLEYKAQFQQQVTSVVKEAKFYEENTTCPTCTQDIHSELREEKLSGAREKSRELKDALDHAASESANLEEEHKRLREVSNSVAEANSEIHSNNQAIERLQKSIREIEESITELEGKGGDLQEANTRLDELKEQKETLTEKKLDLMGTQTYKQAAAEMLKDSGIKTKIVKEYLPAMNQLINKYLQVLDFFVSFHLDEAFNESIKSRYRDTFNYASFSEGEKSRIDLALLFTWRQIARMKNSTSTNLLVLDETFDSSLDVEGVDNLLKILGTLDEDTNTFVISHKGDQLDGKFDHKMVARKEHNFSTLVSEE